MMGINPWTLKPGRMSLRERLAYWLTFIGFAPSSAAKLFDLKSVWRKDRLWLIDREGVVYKPSRRVVLKGLDSRSDK